MPLPHICRPAQKRHSAHPLHQKKKTYVQRCPLPILPCQHRSREHGAHAFTANNKQKCPLMPPFLSPRCHASVYDCTCQVEIQIEGYVLATRSVRPGNKSFEFITGLDGAGWGHIPSSRVQRERRSPIVLRGVLRGDAAGRRLHGRRDKSASLPGALGRQRQGRNRSAREVTRV